MATIPLQHLSDDQLAAATTQAAGLERRSTSELLALLIEVERRHLHLALGYSSMFVYCVRALRLSEQAAYSRIAAARAARRFPQLLALLADGALTLSSVGLLAPHLTDDTVEPILDAARFKSTRDVERLLAAWHPQPDIPASVRALPQPRFDMSPMEPPRQEVIAETQSAPPTAPSRIPTPRARVAPIAPTRYLLRLTIGQDTHDKLTQARALLRHAVPDGDLATIVDRALTLLLRDAERTKHAAVSRPRPAQRETKPGRSVPAGVKRAVWSRDEGRCAFRGPEGRCGEAGFLEFHHVVPFAMGGATTESNLELRCRAHNAYESTQFSDAGSGP